VDARPVAADGRDRGRPYQPLVLLGVVAVTLPVTLRRTPDEYLGVVVATLALISGASVAAWLGGRRLGHRGRTLVSWGLITLGAVALLFVTHLAVPERPELALPFAAGIAVSIAPVRRTTLRLPVQVLVVLGMAALLIAAGRPGREAALTILLLGFVVWLSQVLANSLLDARRAQQRARMAAERRAALLGTVRELSGGSPTRAARTVVDSLRSLGLSVAGVSLVRDEHLVPLALDGIPPPPSLRVGDGVAGAAVAENATLVAEHYSLDGRRLPVRAEVGSVIAVPVRSAGEAVGVLLGGRREAGAFPDEVVEVAEVLASHLGGVLETEQRLGRQRELLDRMRALEDMRGELVTEVSEEIRDPLTVVRGIAETLRAHGDRLPADRREQLLRGFEDQAGALRETIDALLDFSRLQADRPLAVPGLVALGEFLLSVLPAEVVIEGDLDTVVRADSVLMGRMLEFISGLGEVRRASVTTDETTAWLRLDSDVRRTSTRARLVLGLAERLAVSAGGRWTLEDRAVVVGLLRDDAASAESPA
jgi:putative methionine-R-sulfoxide reductase with GAF domain